MSKNNLGLFLNSNSKHSKSKEALINKRGNSQKSFKKIQDIITQVKPFFCNNFSPPLSIHKSTLTPTNKTRDMLQPNLLLPPKPIENIHKKTIILDLDETLVHSSTTSFKKNDIILNIDFDSVLYNIYVLVRPGAEIFIKKLSKLFEVVIFTASISKYASPLLDKLDKDQNIKYRLFREHCTFLNGIFIKELKRLNRDLKDVIIVDNSPLAYAFDASNGLPIKSWYDDKNDNEFEKIFPLLEFLSEVDDVRDYIGLFVENNEIKYEEANRIIKAINNIENNTNYKNNESNINNNKNNNNCIDNKSNNDNNSNNIFSLYDFLNINRNKIIGNIFNKNNSKFVKKHLKLEDYNIPNANHLSKNKHNIKNNDNKNNNEKINNNIYNNLNELNPKKPSFRNKKNIFRLNQKFRDTSPKHFSNNINNKKVNCLLPLSLSVTNSTKMINFKESENNNMNNLKLVSIKETSKDNNSSPKNIKNEHKYTYFLEKFEKIKNLYNNSLINNKNNIFLTRNSESFILNKNKSPLINSNFLNKQPYLSINNKNNLINGSYYTFKSRRSKSTSNFMKPHNNNVHPKTPKGNQRLYNLELFDEKNSLKLIYSNKLDRIKLSQTTDRKFTPSIKPINRKIKIKKLELKKEI